MKNGKNFDGKWMRIFKTPKKLKHPIWVGIRGLGFYQGFENPKLAVLDRKHVRDSAAPMQWRPPLSHPG
jgi:hypothetical protein